MPQCIICLDDKPKTFQANSRCVHHVCGPCLTQYLLSHLKTPQIEYTMVRCPENACNQHYRLDRIHTRGIFEEHEINDWWKALLVHTCFDSKGTCPYPDCGALFELYDESGGYEEDSYGECYECERPICLICETPWHPGRPCRNDRRCWKRTTPEWKTRRLSRENSILARKVADEQGWTQCPQCKEMVMRSSGCNTIRCRCGKEFCYRCGGSSRNHNCQRQCHNMSDSQLRKLRESMYAYPEAANHGLPPASE